MQATLALDQQTGAILQMTGHISSSYASSSRGTASANAASNPLEDKSKAIEETQGAEELASMVWKFVNAAGGLVQGLDPEVCVH